MRQFKAATGFQAQFSVYNIAVELVWEMSLGQIWLVAGEGTSKNTFEAGIQVNPLPRAHSSQEHLHFVVTRAGNEASNRCACSKKAG